MPVVKIIKNVYSGPLCKKCGNMMDLKYAGKYYCSDCQKHEVAKYALKHKKPEKYL